VSDELDKGVDRETRPPKPCSARMQHGGWCLLADHPATVAHSGRPRIEKPPAIDFGPKHKRMVPIR
jgi:hypothetical protein